MTTTAAWPDRHTLMAAIDDACRAPSVHNTQPWTWLLGARSVHLMADRTRWMRGTDPEGRDLVISCGAALHHLKVALAARGRSTADLPTSGDPDHLAALSLVPGGVPTTSAPPHPVRHNGVATRGFLGGGLGDAPTGPQESDAGELLVLATQDDDSAAWLRAGEAVSAVLLTAESRGLATCPLSHGADPLPGTA
jgi:hypothetical protein